MIPARFGFMVFAQTAEETDEIYGEFCVETQLAARLLDIDWKLYRLKHIGLFPPANSRCSRRHSGILSTFP